MNMATCCEGDILNHVIPFISQHMEDPDWRKREAAIMAFGSILEGPPAEKLKQFIDQYRFHLRVEKTIRLNKPETPFENYERLCQLLSHDYPMNQ